MDVSVVIVTYNSQDDIAACVESVLAQNGVSFEVIVVDNASADETLTRLKRLDVKTIASSENLGFGRGCNLGFSHSKGRYVYVLNPDAQLVGEKALAVLCKAMDEHPAWGMAGTKVCDAAGGNEIVPWLQYPGQRHVRQDFSGLPGEIAWVIGASMIFRSEIYKQLGGFDPNFFLYGEETDLCLRVRKSGFEIGYVPEAAVRHIGGASSHGVDPYIVSTRIQKGALNFWHKHYTPEEVEFLVRRSLMRSRFRSFTNGVAAKFQPPESKFWQKSRWYLGIFDTSKKFLSQKNRSFQ